MTSKDKLDQIIQMLSILLGYTCDLYNVSMETNSMIKALELRTDQLTSFEVQKSAPCFLSKMLDLRELDQFNRDTVETIMYQLGRPIDVDKLSAFLGGGRNE